MAFRIHHKRKEIMKAILTSKTKDEILNHYKELVKSGDTNKMEEVRDLLSILGYELTWDPILQKYCRLDRI